MRFPTLSIPHVVSTVSVRRFPLSAPPATTTASAVHVQWNASSWSSHSTGLSKRQRVSGAFRSTSVMAPSTKLWLNGPGSSPSPPQATMIAVTRHNRHTRFVNRGQPNLSCGAHARGLVDTATSESEHSLDCLQSLEHRLMRRVEQRAVVRLDHRDTRAHDPRQFVDGDACRERVRGKRGAKLVHAGRPHDPG
jgi:hypothetical protein